MALIGTVLVPLALGGCAEKDGAGDTALPAPDPLPEDCGALPSDPSARVLSVGEDVAAALAAAAPGDTVALADGVWDVSGGVGVDVPAGVTLRSASGNAEAVILEGGYATAEVVTLGDGATLAELTVAHAYGDAVVVRGATDARLYGVRVDAPGGRGVALLPAEGRYPDRAVLGCLVVVRGADDCEPGLDGVQSDGSRVYGGSYDQGACDAPGVRFATGSRDTIVERLVVRSAGYAGVQLGDGDYAEDEPRAYADGSCEASGHVGGEVRNVFAIGGGVRLEEACAARVTHVSAWGGAVSWSFVADATVAWNLAELADGGGATATGNLGPSATDFVDAAAGDLHLAAGSAAIDAATGSTLADDIDGDARDAAPDVGADERNE